MKTFLVAMSLALVPAASVAQVAPVASAPEGKDKLLAEMETWRDIHLPHVFPVNPVTVRFEPRLNDIKAAASAAKNPKELEKPAADFRDWKLSLLHEKFGTAQLQGTAGGSFAQFSAQQIQQAEFSAALRAQVAQTHTEQLFLHSQQRSFAAAQNPSLFFDGAGAHSDLTDASAVAAAPRINPKDPARYAKVRAILMSQGARKSVVDMAIQEAIRQNADPLLVLAVIKQESGFNTHAVSGVGARGLMQIMPDTGRGLGVRDSGALYDAQTNLRAGIKYLKQLWNRFTDIDMTSFENINPFSSHDAKAAVAAYNAGPGAVHKYGGVPPYRETQGYVKKVLGYYSQLKEYLSF